MILKAVEHIAPWGAIAAQIMRANNGAHFAAPLTRPMSLPHSLT